MKAIITYCPDAQKTHALFDRILTKNILRDICVRITGQTDYAIVRDTSTFNKGRLVLLEYNGIVNYISLSEDNIRGRNSSLQSVPTAINIYYADSRTNKHMCYYFIPHIGNAYTGYHLFIYKLLATAGVQFLNMPSNYQQAITPYRNVDDLIVDRRENQTSNSSNNSSYVSKSIDKIQIYAKTYGASKYESTLLALAVSNIADRPVDLFNICEQDLKRLPQASINTLEKLGNINLYDTSLSFEKHQFAELSNKNELRSPAYQYNLLRRIGYKRCALCGCEIPEIIQGAHIWGVAQIAKASDMDEDKRFMHAISGHNGLWLCQNHHKLFDSNIILFDHKGNVKIKNGLAVNDVAFIRNTTFNHRLDVSLMSDDFRGYIIRRNKNLDLVHYHSLTV